MDSQTRIDAQTAPLIDISGIFSILWRRKLLILLCFFGSVALAFAYLSVTKPVYTANAVILIDPREANATSTPNVLGGIGSDSAAIASQVSIISSAQSLRTVFASLNLENDPEFNAPGLIGGLLGRSSNPEAAFDSFHSRLGVEREGLTYVINIGFTSSDAQKAATIANAIAEQYISGQVAEKSGVSNEVTGQLNQSISQLRQQVAEAETAVQNHRIEHNLFDTGTGRTLVEEQIAQLNAQLSTARDGARDALSRYEQARAIGASASGLDRLSQFLSSGSAEQLRNTYNQSLTELANAQATLGPQHPTRLRLSAQVTQLENQMRDEAARIITELKADSELASANVARVEDDLTRLQTQSALTNKQTVELRQLERNAEASRQVLEQFLARSEQTSQLDDLQRPDARMVSEAMPPLRAAWPRRSLVLGGAGLIGLMLGSLIALIAERAPTLARAEQQADKQPTDSTSAQIDRAGPARRRQRPMTAIQDMGLIASRYAPPNHYLPTQDYLDAIHKEASDYPNDAFAHDIRDLFCKLADNLPETAPVVVHLCGYADRLESTRLAFALAHEAHNNGWEPIILDLDPLKKTSDTGRRKGSFPQNIDAETGLTVITPHGDTPHGDGRINDLKLTESVIDEHADECDIFLVIGKPLIDPATLGTDFSGADANMIVLSSTENHRQAKSKLSKRATPDTLPVLVTVDHGTFPATKTNHHRQDEVGRAVAELRHLVRRAS